MTISLHAERSRRSFTASDVCAIAGITYRQLDYWTRTGLVDASSHPSTGHGDVRRYRDTDALRVCVIAALVNAGMGLASTREHLSELLEHHEVFTGNVTITVGVDRLRDHVERYRRAAS